VTIGNTKLAGCQKSGHVVLATHLFGQAAFDNKMAWSI